MSDRRVTLASGRAELTSLKHPNDSLLRRFAKTHPEARCAYPTLVEIPGILACPRSYAGRAAGVVGKRPENFEVPSHVPAKQSLVRNVVRQAQPPILAS